MSEPLATDTVSQTPSKADRVALIVEDDEVTGKALAKLLQARELRTVVIREPDEARAWIVDHAPQLVLLDLSLRESPDDVGVRWERGLDLLRSVRADGYVRPIVVRSAFISGGFAPLTEEAMRVKLLDANDDKGDLLLSPKGFGSEDELDAMLDGVVGAITPTEPTRIDRVVRRTGSVERFLLRAGGVLGAIVALGAITIGAYRWLSSGEPHHVTHVVVESNSGATGAPLYADTAMTTVVAFSPPGTELEIDCIALRASITIDHAALRIAGPKALVDLYISANAVTDPNGGPLDATALRRC